MSAPGGAHDRRASGAGRPWLREPLLHFVALGALAFGLYGLVAPVAPADGPDATTAAQMLELTDARRNELKISWRDKTGRWPTDAEFATLVAQWIDREILYVEGVAMGLEKEDPIIRDEVIRRMVVTQQALAEVQQPTPAELEDYYQRHRDVYTKPRRWDVQHVYEPGLDPGARARAEAHATALRGGADPSALGARYPKGNAFRLRSQANLDTIFGAPVGAAVAGAAAGTWIVTASADGWHVIRATREHPAVDPPLAAIAAELRADWEGEVRRAAVGRWLERMRGSYEVALPDGERMAADVLARNPALAPVGDDPVAPRQPAGPLDLPAAVPGPPAAVVPVAPRPRPRAGEDGAAGEPGAISPR